MVARRFWGWGYEDAGPDAAQLAAVEAGLRHFLGLETIHRRPRPTIDAVTLPPSRLEPPSELAAVCSSQPLDRAAHTYGKSYRDVVRAVAHDFARAPDLVAFPTNEQQLESILEYCSASGAAAIPYGGGSSVCGGVEPADLGRFERAVSIDLGRLDSVLEIDATSRAARIQAGIYGPALEDALRPHGLSLRHFPQSFEFSSLGGWIATRSGGHFATLWTHIDELVESMRLVTPTGVVDTPRLPGSGAGPDPNRLFMGSEGTLGIITEAWMRLQPRPRFRARFAATFDSFESGAIAARALAQSGLFPSNCRLLDPLEAMLNGAGDGNSAVLLVGFESGDHALGPWIDRAAELVRDHGGSVPADSVRVRSEGDREQAGAAGAWRDAFLRAPYLRDELVLMGLFVETFETAVTWDRFDALVATVHAAAGRASRETGGAGLVTCRLTHVYPDGAAPYFTVIAPAAAGHELAQWKAIKTAVTDAVLEHGGTTTHHHAVGRDFRRFYERERPEGVALALSGAKRALDPDGILNPGVLLPAEP